MIRADENMPEMTDDELFEWRVALQYEEIESWGDRMLDYTNDADAERAIDMYRLFAQADRLHSRIMRHPALDVDSERYERMMHKTLMRAMRRRAAYRMAVYGPDGETDNGD